MMFLLKAAAKFIFALLLLLGGIKAVSWSLRQLSGGKFHDLLKKTVSTPWRGFCAGLAATIFLQSSSLVTVMVVGFINGGFFTLTQGLSVIIGANLGTTITSQLFSLETSSLIMPLLSIGAGLYFLELFMGKSLGARVLLSITFVLFGIHLMVLTLEPFSQTAFFRQLLTFSGESYWKGIVTGTVAAAVIQSSSVTIGMVILLAREGYLSFPEALAIILGADLGTCLTSLFASIGTIPPAKRVALGHLLFNFMTIIFVLPFWNTFQWAVEMTSGDISRQVANAHVLYNLLGVIIFLPLVDKFAIFLQNIMVKEKDNKARRKKAGFCRRKQV